MSTANSAPRSSPAAEALDAVPGTGTAAVLATGTTAGWTIAIRDEGTLIRIEKNPQGQVTWWHYSLGKPNQPDRDRT